MSSSQTLVECDAHFWLVPAYAAAATPAGNTGFAYRIIVIDATTSRS